MWGKKGGGINYMIRLWKYALMSGLTLPSQLALFLGRGAVFLIPWNAFPSPQVRHMELYCSVCVLCNTSLANRGIHPNSKTALHHEILVFYMTLWCFLFKSTPPSLSWLGCFTTIPVPFVQFKILILTSKPSQSFVAAIHKFYGCVPYSIMQAIKKVLNRTELKTKSCRNSFEMSSEFDNKTLIMLTIWWFHINPHFSASENVMRGSIRQTPY